MRVLLPLQHCILLWNRILCVQAAVARARKTFALPTLVVCSMYATLKGIAYTLQRRSSSTTELSNATGNITPDVARVLACSRGSSLVNERTLSSYRSIPRINLWLGLNVARN